MFLKWGKVQKHCICACGVKKQLLRGGTSMNLQLRSHLHMRCFKMHLFFSVVTWEKALTAEAAAEEGGSACCFNHVDHLLLQLLQMRCLSKHAAEHKYVIHPCAVSREQSCILTPHYCKCFRVKWLRTYLTFLDFGFTYIFWDLDDWNVKQCLKAVNISSTSSWRMLIEEDWGFTFFTGLSIFTGCLLCQMPKVSQYLCATSYIV